MKFRGLCLFLFLALGVNAYAQAPNLQTSGTFAVLAGGGIISADAGTTIVGDVGSSPTPAVTGLLATQVTGTLYTAANAVLTTAKNDLTAAYLDAAGRPSCTALTGALGGATNPNLGPGVYCYSSAALLNGTLTLTGSSTDVWIFQIGSTLTTATGASVVFAGGASPCNVFWQIGSSATIGVGNKFAGVIMALASITLDGGTLNGRALAQNGVVTIAGSETIINSCSPTSSVPSIVLTPATASFVCGADATFVNEFASVLLNGVPVANTPVTFNVTSGPDAGRGGTQNTDASGTAQFQIKLPSLYETTPNTIADIVTATINGGTVVSNTTTVTCRTPPPNGACNPTRPNPTVTVLTQTPGPPKQVVFSVQAANGLFSVVANTPPTTNATVHIPIFDTATILPIGVIAIKIDQSSSAVVELTVADFCGDSTVFDPVFATITISAARSRFAADSPVDSDVNSDTQFATHVKSVQAAKFDFDHWEVTGFDGIGRTEGRVLLQNGTPGVESVVIIVNGAKFKTRLSDGQTKKIDISSALFHGKNTVSVAVFGDSGSSVDLTISDGK